jgi:acyl-CoA dehydrogenase
MSTKVAAKPTAKSATKKAATKAPAKTKAVAKSPAKSSAKPSGKSSVKATKASKPASAFGLNPTDELHDLRMSEKVQPLYEHVKRFIKETVEPMSVKYFALDENRVGKDRWNYAPGQLDLLNGAKDKAKKEGLWNFFLPDADTGEGLSNLDYAYIAAELGKNPLASESMNCSAPDTGNMEVIERVGTPAQKEKWLKPLLNGEIRSAYAMTEVHHASSDAKNVATTAVLKGNQWVINGEKHYISGAGSPRCKILITMVRTSPNAAPHKQQSMILVPKDTPGVKIVGAMHVFGEDHAPHGHMHIIFDNVKVPKENMLLGEGRGFEISQLRLGPGRIHHCMRSIGQAEKALDLLVERGISREAFGKKLVWLGGNIEIISRARIEIESMRMMVLKAAKAMDVLGNREARIWVHMVKALVPERVCVIIDQAIQMHGALGVSQKTPLAKMYAMQRTLRLADGPDEVHHLVVGRNEVRMHEGSGEDSSMPVVFRS